MGEPQAAGFIQGDDPITHLRGEAGLGPAPSSGLGEYWDDAHAYKSTGDDDAYARERADDGNADDG